MAEVPSRRDEVGAAPLTPAQFRFLRYWSLNMKLARRTGQDAFPGFSYDANEQARMDALATGASASAIMLWLAAVVAAYLLVAIVAVGGVIGTALVTVWRNIKDVPEAEIFTAIALMLVMMIGLGMPLSIGAGGWIADAAWRALPAQSPGDVQLFAKVKRQFRRMALVTGVLFVAAAFGWGVLLRGR
jgi:hypothetical protein